MNAKSFESEAYWTERYNDPQQRRGELFDWYILSFAKMAHVIAPLLVQQFDQDSADGLPSLRDAPVALVDVGCGNSPFLTDAAAYVEHCNIHSSREKRFVGTDFSEVAVADQIRLLSSSHQQSNNIHVVFVHQDARTNIGVDDASAALVMDKATLDAVDCSGNEENAAAVVATCVRSLVPGGHFVSLTCRPTARRTATILNGIEQSGVPCEHVSTVSLNNDPVSPSHLLVFRRTVVQ